MTLAGSMERQILDAASRFGTGDWQRVAVDAHVHLRGDVASSLKAAARNFSAAGTSVDAGAVLLTDSETVDTFRTLSRGGLPRGIHETGEAISLVSRLGAVPVPVAAGGRGGRQQDDDATADERRGEAERQGPALQAP